MHATVNEPVPLCVVLADGVTTLFARAFVYNGSSLLTTVDLPHITNGMYQAEYTPTEEEYLTVLYKVYTDSGYTTLGLYGTEVETIEVNSLKTNVLRILGLLHQNSVIDQEVYNVDGNMVSSRIRSYDSAANATAAGSTGLLFTWQVSVTYTIGSKISNFTILSVP
jgi:hypothetical protein